LGIVAGAVEEAKVEDYLLLLVGGGIVEREEVKEWNRGDEKTVGSQ
jgi:hypothetical protein